MKLELSSLKFETAMPAVATFLLVALFDCRSLAKGICVSLSLLIFRLLPRRLTIRMSAFFFSNLISKFNEFKRGFFIQPKLEY